MRPPLPQRQHDLDQSVGVRLMRWLKLRHLDGHDVMAMSHFWFVWRYVVFTSGAFPWIHVRRQRHYR
jgi:hypothetical protein